MVSVIIPFRDKVELLQTCLKSVLNVSKYRDFEVLLVDNGSKEAETLKYLESVKDVENIRILKYLKPFNFSAINNFAAREAKGEYLLFLNNDTEVISKDWLGAMLELFNDRRVGAVGAKLLYPNKTIQHAGIVLREDFVAANAFNGFIDDEDPKKEFNRAREWNAVTAACMMTRKEIFETVGGFDEEHLPIAYNDVDYCLKLREKEYKIMYTPKALLHHYESATRGLDELKKNEKRYADFLQEQAYIRMRWEKYIKTDEFFKEEYITVPMAEVISDERKRMLKEVMHLLKMTKKVYRERGLTNLFARVFGYLYDFFAAFFIRRSDVLYVSGCPGGSRLYRCANQSEEVGQYGLKCAILSQDNPILVRVVSKFDTFIFQRVIFNDHIEKLMNEIKKQNKKIIFETDDLVFDPSYIPYFDYYNFMGSEEKSWYDNGIGREVLEDAYVKQCIVSTDFLKQAMKQKYPDKEVLVSYNKLNRNQVKNANDVFVRKMSLQKNDGKIRIGYFSGSRSHNKDFEAVEPVLLKILQGNKNAVLRVVGHLDLSKDFASVKSQIEILEFVSLKKLQELIATVDINIAPLEIKNPFCQAKSALKYFEAGILGVPTIATATPDFVRCIKDGVNGFVVHNTKEWEERLKQLIEDAALRESIRLAAREDVLLNHTTAKKHQVTEELVNNFLR
jgi:GT2 family glycosyltransferase